MPPALRQQVCPANTVLSGLAHRDGLSSTATPSGLEGPANCYCSFRTRHYDAMLTRSRQLSIESYRVLLIAMGCHQQQRLLVWRDLLIVIVVFGQGITTQC